MIVVSTATFPVDQIREVVINRWAKEVVNNPAPDYMTVRGPYSMTDPDKGLVVMSIIELDDAKLAELERQCRGGEILCGEHKADLLERVNAWLERHQAAREEARERLDEYILRD